MQLQTQGVPLGHPGCSSAQVSIACIFIGGVVSVCVVVVVVVVEVVVVVVSVPIGGCVRASSVVIAYNSSTAAKYAARNSDQVSNCEV